MQSIQFEKHPIRTKIIATVGPASASKNMLRALAVAGVAVFRLNFAHGKHEWLEQIVARIREISIELNQPIGILGDLAGPKIRLGILPEEGVECQAGQRFIFVRNEVPFDGLHLSSTYEHLVDDLKPGDKVLLADGTVGMQVVEKTSGHEIICEVERPGIIRSKQGINLPGAKLQTPALTEKDKEDLAWGLKQKLNFFGLSFVRHAKDLTELRELIDELAPDYTPKLIAKIEKPEAIQEMEAITKACDCVMIARGDLGVETDISWLPVLQKQLIRHCNERRIPVITATQMLDSMQYQQFPTRAEANDVANAVLDGSDAVMLSGETAVGKYPIETVEMMSRIILHSEDSVPRRTNIDWKTDSKSRALVVTEAVTLGACTVADQLDADLMVLCTESGRTALAISRQRSQIPLLALSDSAHTARTMCLYWGVMPVHSAIVKESPEEILDFAIKWGTGKGLLKPGSRIVLISDSKWGAEGHDVMMVHVVS